MSIIDREVIDSIVKELEIEDIRSASIRQVGAVVRAAEARTGVEFVHFEMGVPGLPPSAVGVKAECDALQRGVASVYPIIDGIPEVKEQASRFVKAFLNTEIRPEGCIPTVGSILRMVPVIISPPAGYKHPVPFWILSSNRHSSRRCEPADHGIFPALSGLHAKQRHPLH